MQHKTPYLAMLTNVTNNLCIGPLIRIPFKVEWVLLWPMLHPSTKFPKNPKKPNLLGVDNGNKLFHYLAKSSMRGLTPLTCLYDKNAATAISRLA